MFRGEHRTEQVFPQGFHGKTSKRESKTYGVGLAAVVDEDELLRAGFVARLNVFGSTALSVAFCGAGEGAAIWVCCSQAPRSAAPARMQSIFFMV